MNDLPQRPEDELRTAATHRYEPEPEPDAAFVLHVVEGPDRGAELVVDGRGPGPALVGQSPSCALRLADREVSRRHAALEVEGRRLRITDLQSTNGTFVDGVAILDAYLSGGEVVRLGSSGMRIERRAPSTPTGAPAPRAGLGRFIGQSPELLRLYPFIERLAASDVPIVIEGETGTGKEVLAEAIHESSPRRNGPYVVLDCTTLPPNLVESELFGHERGAFTGATAPRQGVFELAHGGTLLIDEIGDLELALQPKLLRALERGEIRRVGGGRISRVDVRVIAATRRDLDRSIQAGTFRDDLFHRLAVGRIALPPLRKRRGDIAALARHFWRELAGPGPIPGHLLDRWESYDWPGNVRELRNAVARQVAAGDVPAALPESAIDVNGAIEGTADAAAAILARAEGAMCEVLRARLPISVARVRLLEQLQKAYTERALIEHGGDVERAAAALGVGRRYFNMLKVGRRRR